MTKADVEKIVESRLTEWTSSLRSQIPKGAKSTFENAFLEGYFNFNAGLKTALLKVAEQAMGKMILCGHILTISKAEM